MAAPKWAPGTLYPTGSIVQPLSSVTPAGSPIVNPGPTGSAAGWSLVAPWVYDGTKGFSPGQGSFKFNTGFSGFSSFAATAGIPVAPGTSITASCLCEQGATAAGQLGLNVQLFWYDAGDVFISNSAGNIVNNGANGAWITSTVTGQAPAGAAFVRIGASGVRNAQNFAAWVGNFQWNYVSNAAADGLVFKAVQPTTGTSAGSEPAWPATVGVQVIDNTVIWEAILATRVTWEAKPIMESGATEPVWPTALGGEVADGTMRWVAVERRVTDVNCPQSKVVTIGQSKIYASDGDIVRYSATVNPLDWTTENNAGYLPTGLQAVGAINTQVLNQYRSNLVGFTPSTFQNWQIDPDPANMAYLDGIEGIGSSFHRAAQPVANDLFYLAPLGVRSVGIAAGSTNLAAGDVGMPIDPIVQDAVLAASQTGARVRSTYWPSSGQYWLSFANYPPMLAVNGNLPNGEVGNLITPYQYDVAGGFPPYVFDILSGALPPGLSMSSSGLVTGTPTTAGDYSWVVRVTDNVGNTATVPDESVISNIGCSLTQTEGGADGFPIDIVVELGTAIGTVYFDYDAFNEPDKFHLIYDGVTLLDTGYIGENTAAQQTSLNARLATEGQPPETMGGPGAGMFSFFKATATPAFATVRVFAPGAPGSSFWQFLLGCPGAPATHPFRTAILADAPYDYYRFREAAGSTFFASIGSGYNRIQPSVNGITAGVSPLYPQTDLAVTFNGTSQNLIGVGATVSANWRHLGDLTLVYALKFNALPTPGNTACLLAVGASGEIESTNVLMQTSINNVGGVYNITCFHENGAGVNNTVQFNYAFAVGVNYLIHMVRDTVAKTYTVYINGVSLGTTVYANNPTGGSTSQLSIGNNPTNAVDWTSMTLDELVFYKSVLSPSVIAAQNAAILL